MSASSPSAQLRGRTSRTTVRPAPVAPLTLDLLPAYTPRRSYPVRREGWGVLSAAVMLPTYNEADNIRRVVEQILAQPVDVTVVVVDDQSPDGTGKIADELALEHPGRVHVVHRTGPRGRGVAGVDGFKYCLGLPVDCIIEMDADLSHDPDDIPRLLAAAQSADLVMGSRYVRGGGEANRLLYRRIISRFANMYLRFMLGLPIRDCSSGYRCFRRHVLESIGLDEIASHGPSILTEILWQCKLLQFKIREVPIVFREREVGESKLNGTILLNSLKLPVTLRFGGRIPGIAPLKSTRERQPVR